MIITFTKMKKEKQLRLSIPDIIPSVNSKNATPFCIHPNVNSQQAK